MPRMPFSVRYCAANGQRKTVAVSGISTGFGSVFAPKYMICNFIKREKFGKAGKLSEKGTK